MKATHTIATITALICTLPVFAQYAWQTGETAEPLKLTDNVEYAAEMQASVSDGKTPLWLNANKHGMSSLESFNGYLRGKIARPIETDSARRLAVGYGIDIALAANYTSTIVLQQAYVEARWLHWGLSIGAKERPMEFKNQQLSSGSQCFGINARPIPQIRTGLPQWWALPLTKRWVSIRGGISFGMMTDDSWQHSFTNRESRYADNVLFHSKGAFIKFGSEQKFPLTLQLGGELGAQFGGTLYYLDLETGTMASRKGGSSAKDFLDVFTGIGGGDETDGEYKNVAGNQLGAYMARLTYTHPAFMLSAYLDHYFEDHSQMLFLDYDGYGEGDAYNERLTNRYYHYRLKDALWGLELNLKHGTWIKDIVVEYLYTKNQSGPYNHDHTRNISDHMAGKDDYYNHTNYTGWQHWGQVIGNPLYRSPIYNDDGTIFVKNNRFQAVHIGIAGQPLEKLSYRLLASWQDGLGRYDDPYTYVHDNVSILCEATYQLPKSWSIKCGIGLDTGDIIGNNTGLQLTVRKTGILGKKM